MSGMVLLASYPKSGNTWMRSLLASVKLGGRTPDINADLGSLSASSRSFHDAMTQMECSDLTPSEIARLRPAVSRWLAQEQPGLYKAHEAYLAPPGAAEPAIPADAIDRLIFITRDPRDVAVSLAHHLGVGLQVAVETLRDEAFMLGRSVRRLNSQVEQHISSWSAHTRSWLDVEGVRRLHVRYEDMTDHPAPVLADVCRFLDWPAEPAVIAGSVEAASFQQLAGQEAAAGFRERYPTATASFFREGRAGAWRDHLPADLAERIVEDHGPMMRRLGYL